MLLAAQRIEDVPASPLFGMMGLRDRLQHPTDPEDPQAYDRGKKQGPTLTNLLVINETGDLGCLRHTCAGTASDQSLAELAGDTVPPGSCLYQDQGFQGFSLPDMTLVQPQKTPRGGERTPPEQATNRRMSSISIRIEHAIGGVKRDRMVKDNIRLLKDGLRATMMETCGGLQNFRLQYRPWHDAS